MLLVRTIARKQPRWYNDNNKSMKNIMWHNWCGMVWANCVYSTFDVCIWVYMCVRGALISPRQTNKINELEYLCVKFFSFHSFLCFPFMLERLCHGIAWRGVYTYANHCITNTWTIARHHINFGWSFLNISLIHCTRTLYIYRSNDVYANPLVYRGEHDKVMVKPCCSQALLTSVTQEN